jgi:hypothetical protein
MRRNHNLRTREAPTHWRPTRRGSPGEPPLTLTSAGKAQSIRVPDRDLVLLGACDPDMRPSGALQEIPRLRKRSCCRQDSPGRRFPQWLLGRNALKLRVLGPGTPGD